VTARVRATFFTVAQDHVKELARGYSVMHVGLSIPPLGKGEATAQCTFNHDVLVAVIGARRAHHGLSDQAFFSRRHGARVGHPARGAVLAFSA
jgi:hypothetical protein